MDEKGKSEKGERLGEIMNTLQISRGRSNCLKPQKEVVKSHQDEKINSMEMFIL